MFALYLLTFSKKEEEEILFTKAPLTAKSVMHS